MQYSPLRYPGGKRRLASFVGRILDANGLRDIQYVEPYAGGAAIGLALLFEGRAKIIHLNDLDRAVYAFWYAALNKTSHLCSRIEKTPISMEQWRKQRAIYNAKESSGFLDLGFATLFLNRTNRSGILSGGAIGGTEQAGTWHLDARFNKQEVITRIQRIAQYKTRIRLYQEDAQGFIQRVVPELGDDSFIFFDPPYIKKGDTLYLNNYGLDDHRALARSISGIDKPWLVTYDIDAAKNGLFPSHRRLVYSLSYSAYNRYRGKEVMFFSDRLVIPAEWRTGEVLVTADEGPSAVFGRIQNMPFNGQMDEGPLAARRFEEAVRALLSPDRRTTKTSAGG
jgi:DNA adenine methylase